MEKTNHATIVPLTQVYKLKITDEELPAPWHGLPTVNGGTIAWYSLQFLVNGEKVVVIIRDKFKGSAGKPIQISWQPYRVGSPFLSGFQCQFIVKKKVAEDIITYLTQKIRLNLKDRSDIYLTTI